MVTISLRVTEEQLAFLENKLNKSAYIRRLIVREMQREEGELERKVREIVQQMLENVQFIRQGSNEELEKKCVSGIMDILS